jgi:predicted DNA-binding transcriptional regulator AlpA
MTRPARPPTYVSRATLAAEIDIAESTVDDMVRRGVLPKPLRLSTGCVRWAWHEVETALQSLKEGAPFVAADPYMLGADSVTKIPEGRGRVS